MLACGVYMQTLICNAMIREITFGLCVDGRAFVKLLDYHACREDRGGLQAMYRRQETWKLALTLSVAQGVVIRMRHFLSCYPTALSDADCTTWHGVLSQPFAARCKPCLSEAKLLALKRDVLPSDHPQAKCLHKRAADTKVRAGV